MLTMYVAIFGKSHKTEFPLYVRLVPVITSRTLFQHLTYNRLDFHCLGPGQVFDPPQREVGGRGMSAGSFSRTAAGNRAYI